MSLFSNIAPLLRAPVGNNRENDQDDIINIKHNFSAQGFYRPPVRNGYIDRELDEAITTFQQDNDLKIDGVMKPGGETEATLISKILEIPQIPPSKEERKAGYRQASAVPLFGILGLGLGMTATGAAQWWMNQNTETREKIVGSLKDSIENGTGDPDEGEECMDRYERDMDTCKKTAKYGAWAKGACEETAATAMSQCLRGMPPKDRRQLQTEFE